ncbi:DUF523 domain-containing protein [Sulfurovum sp. zt1-1]|uniref:DUF523 domain-containing protein n=1 Tax=Sulfurovum zhangzhouensis TaxID=3019067 RepID=A0ABT7QZL5_9BACT|nr:DUF523 domain-containing protein [Sulfurovum zhangzhouensis]MDM5272248.1 DUF523 domain-containing protein [Sulfurovum zhangzhouensis]
MRKVAISACLLGQRCRYDGDDNYAPSLLQMLQEDELIPFCPEDAVFGSPRPTMDLVQTPDLIEAVCNESGKLRSNPIRTYAKNFFDQHGQIDLFIGKDRSPSCGVCSARLYDEEKNLLSSCAAGLMAQEAIDRNIAAIDAEKFEGKQ